MLYLLQKFGKWQNKLFMSNGLVHMLCLTFSVIHNVRAKKLVLQCGLVEYKKTQNFAQIKKYKLSFKKIAPTKSYLQKIIFWRLF